MEKSYNREISRLSPSGFARDDDHRMQAEVKQVIEKLGLKPHPEGCFYRETFRSGLILANLPHSGVRNASTAIYFLLPAGTFSSFHVVKSDEMWHFYCGDPLDLHIIGPDGAYERIHLGNNIEAGELPQVAVPAGFLQAAEPVGSNYSLCGCTVAPGFDFKDFEMPDRQSLISRFPQYKSLFERLTRS